MIPKKSYEEVWPILQKSIQRALQSDNFNIRDITFEEQAMYGVALSEQNNGTRVFNALKEEVTNHLEQKVRRDILKSFDSDNFLEFLFACYQKIDYSMVLIRGMLWYVDSLKVDNIWDDKFYDMGRKLFLNLIIRFMRSHLRSMLMHQIKLDRDSNNKSLEEMHGERIVKSSVENICQMLINLDFDGTKKVHMTYEEVFHTPMIKMFINSAKVISGRLLSQKCVSSYIKKAEDVLINESERANIYIEYTKSQLIRSLEEELIEKRMHQFVKMDSGVIFMIENNKKDDLACMYRLLSRVSDGLNILSECVSEHLRAIGKSFFEEEQEVNCTNVVEVLKKLADLKTKFCILLIDCFDDDKLFRTIIYRDIDYVFNLNETLYPAILTFFYNNMERPPSDDNLEVDKLLLHLNRLREERDASFDEFYLDFLKEKLSRNNTFAVTYENSLIPEFKDKFDVDFMTKFEEIVKDSLNAIQQEDEENITDSVDITMKDESNN